ncbi:MULTISPECIES: ABC transporter permease [Actinosynnema]|uniref:ABC transporter permease n=1 Tax=Actinosynnema TaxID=40566 RepID=UPI0020A504AD|nr:ABC transporter permease [Actinosynnema pretiosum]MCP2094219.1 putative ABC transport system permease protein [Actinosynnema pretiosum]
MLRTIIAGLRARTARLVLSSIAIALGVAFVTGTLVLGDAIDASTREEYAKSSRNVAVSVKINGDASELTSVPASALAEVRAVPGVSGADSRSTVWAALVDSRGKAREARVQSVATTPELREFDLADGRFPQSANEIALDERGVKSTGLTIGSTTKLMSQESGDHELTVVGTYRQSSNPMSLGYGEQGVVTPELMAKLGDEPFTTEVVALAAPGSDHAQLRDAVATALGGEYRVRTGAQAEADTMEQLAKQGINFTLPLLVFAAISLVVASMVIYNTFTILVAQRTKELALLRCVGANRSQVFRSVLAEALVMGLVASVLGLGAGLGVAALLQRGIDALGAGGAAGVQTPITWTTVLAAFAVGVLVTVLAAALPARKATRVAPIAALRNQIDSGDDVRRAGKLRIASAALLVVAGAGVLVVGQRSEQLEMSMFASAAGAMLLLAAVLLLGPLLVGPVNKLLGIVPGLLFGVPAKLAVGNAERNPRRTAATTAALIVGVSIVVSVTVVGGSVRETATQRLDEQYPADFTVNSSIYGRQLPVELADRLGEVPQVAQAEPTAEVYAENGYFIGVRRSALGAVVLPEVVEGSLDALGDGDLAVTDEYAKSAGIKIGDRVKVGDVEKRDKAELEVVAVITGRQIGYGLTTLGTAESVNSEQPGHSNVMVKLKEGVSTADGRAALEKVTDTSPLAVISSAAETRDLINSQVNQMLGFVWALIGLAVVIALFGIANTLALSVLERTRETALLRALGLTKGQLRLMLVVESVLMALMGATIGLVLGVGVGWALTSSFGGEGIDIVLDVPVGQIGVMLVAAVVAAVIAAAMPARRAARTSIVSGMAEE